LSSVDDPTRGVVFGPQTTVDDYLDRYAATGRTAESVCNDFAAEEDANRTKGEKNLNTTGVMTAVCSHDFFLNVILMKHGEKFPYALLSLLRGLGMWNDEKGQPTSSNKPTCAWLYDIACRFRPYLRSLQSRLCADDNIRPMLDQLLSMKSGTGAAHVLGHQLRCQLYDSVRTLIGLGLTDGENNERVQSMLVNYVRQLKYQSPINFRKFLEAITDHVNSVKLEKIGATLRSRRLRAFKLLSASCRQCTMGY